MLIVLAFFLNAALNFATGIAVAAVLGPKIFGQFAVASMVAVVLATSMFDWLRLSATRYYNERTRESDPQLRSTLEAAYLVAGGLLAAGALIAALFHVGGWPTALVLVVAAGSFTNGQFEYRSALARARFLNAIYAQLIVSKNILALGSMILAAYLFHSATCVLAALSLSVILSIAPLWRRLRDPKARLASVQWGRVAAFAKYGVPIVIANVLYQIIVLANRWVVAAKLGYADAGQLSLATDMTIRIFLSLGAGFDLLLFQIAVRREAMQGLAAAREQIARNISVIAAVLVPVACGYAVTLPFFERLLVPAAYRGDFARISLVLIPGVLAFSLTQFAFNPVFQLAHKTTKVIWVAAIAAISDIGLIMMLPAGSGPTAFAAVHSFSLALAALVAGFFAFRIKECIPSLRDISVIVVATVLMIAMTWPMRMINPPWLGLFSAVAAGGIVYLVFIFTFNVADVQSILRRESRFLRTLSG